MDLALGAIDILALTLWGEARSEPIEGRIAIACVVRNRLQTGRWGSSYKAVCLARRQFSCWNPGTDSNHLQLMTLVKKVQTGPRPTYPVLSECYWVADGVEQGIVRDRVQGALHYHADTMSPYPSWATSGHLVVHLGHHLFYRGVP